MMLRHLVVAEALHGRRQPDIHRHASFMCGVSSFWRRVGSWLR